MVYMVIRIWTKGCNGVPTTITKVSKVVHGANNLLVYIGRNDEPICYPVNQIESQETLVD